MKNRATLCSRCDRMNKIAFSKSWRALALSSFPIFSAMDRKWAMIVVLTFRGGATCKILMG
jgi:hypothetical protein